MNPNDPSIPIVGQPGKEIGWWPTAIWQCLCQDEELQLIFISGMNNASQCPRCKRNYVILGLKPDDANGVIRTVVATQMPKPPM